MTITALSDLHGYLPKELLERLTMRQKTLDFLEAHKSEQPSTFTEDAKWRQEKEAWLKRTTAMSAVRRMRDCAARHGLQEASLEEINDIIHEVRYGNESTT